MKRWYCWLHRRSKLGRPGKAHPVLLPLGLGTALAFGIIFLLEARLEPIVEAAAQAQASNALTAVVEEAVTADLAMREMGYSDFVSIQRDTAGSITAITTDMAEMNRLRTELVAHVLAALDGVDVAELSIPVGSLWDSDFLWAKGPKIKVYAMRVGTVSAEFSSQFSEAGLNQTLHRIELAVQAPLTLILPGGQTEVCVQTQLCVAETVIVGQVPDTYLQLTQP